MKDNLIEIKNLSNCQIKLAGCQKLKNTEET